MNILCVVRSCDHIRVARSCEGCDYMGESCENHVTI